jgi:bifunctional non-homologous end joining protein LigD
MRLTFGSHEVEISNEDKVLFPDAGVTKGHLVEHHVRMAKLMLPHLEGRPIAMRRFPDGIEGEGFFQKETPDHFPDWIERVPVRKEGGTVHHVVIRTVADLVYLANQACIEPHPWLSTTEDPERPDRMVFDLDPSDGGLEVVRDAARTLGDLLEELELVAFLMTSGSRGYHLWVPIEPDETFDSVRSLARRVAEHVVRKDPDSFTIEQRKAKRGDRVLIDYLRNAYAQTSIPPYAVRARPGAPVAVPLDWSELSRVEPRDYTIANIARRLGQKDDPWQGIDRQARTLEAARKRLDDLD